MKVLFIVQGEGRGHLTQAITLEEILRRNGHEVVEVLVGKSNTRRLPGFFNRSIQAPVKRFLSPNFLPTPANKRVSMSRSIAYNLMQVPAYLRSICYIHRRIHETDADLVINFYELLTGLTYLFSALLYRRSVSAINIFSCIMTLSFPKESYEPADAPFFYTTHVYRSQREAGSLIPSDGNGRRSAYTRGTAFTAARSALL